jgi:hypothetical protein
MKNYDVKCETKCSFYLDVVDVISDFVGEGVDVCVDVTDKVTDYPGASWCNPKDILSEFRYRSRTNPSLEGVLTVEELYEMIERMSVRLGVQPSSIKFWVKRQDSLKEPSLYSSSDILNSIGVFGVPLSI